MNVPFIDLKKQYLTIKEEVDDAIQRVIDSQNFILGDEVENFEEKFATYCGSKHAIGVASGTDALLLSVKAHDMSDKIITSPFTFFATAGAIHNAGATPTFSDIDLNTFNINPDNLRQNVENQEICGIIPVHLFGQTADMGQILEIAEDNDLNVIEDAAQSVGAKYNGKTVGSMSTTCFSFFPAKNLGCYGDGGIITTNNEEIADKIRTLRVHGSKSKYYHQMIGYNSRLDAIQATVLNVKLKYINKWNDMRKENANFYIKALKNIPEIELPEISSDFSHVFNQFTIRVKSGLRKDLRDFLTKKKISTAIYYPYPLHLQPCFSDLNYEKGSMPNAELVCNEVLSIPIYPEIEEEELEYVAENIIEFFEFIT